MKCLNADVDCKYQLKISMLDGSDMNYEITDETRTQDLLDLVFKQLDLNENIFFGLYNLLADGRKSWLVNNRRINRQISISSSSKSIAHLYFGIKFYINDPCKLRGESSRYQFFLQVKKDILDGKLEVPFDLSAQLFAYALQSELGDYDSEMHKNNYASLYKFQPNQTRKLEEKAEELHKNLIGKTPASVELSFLDEIKHLELYGTELYSVLTDENDENYLALSPTGVMVLHRNSLFAHYYWSNIIGVYKKGKYFMIKIFTKDNEKTTYGFELPNKKLCKDIWKNCVEYQLFFKLVQAYFENNNLSSSVNQTRLDELTQRFRSINLNELIVRKRKTMYNIFHYLIQQVNSLNKNASPKDHLDQLTGINFTADEFNLDNYEPDEIKSNVINEQLNKNEPETSPNLPNGFYLVDQQQLGNSNDKQKSLKQLNGIITTPGYNVVQTNGVMPNRNRKCESVFSVRSQRSRAAYSEMAYIPDKRHHYKHHKHSSHKRRHKRHRHKDCLDYDDDCTLSFDEFEEHSMKHHHHHHQSRKNRSRSYHTLYDNDEADHVVESCCSRNRNNGSKGHRRHRSCCLNELRYDSGQDEEFYMENNQEDDNVSLCSSIHSLSKRRHKRKESSSLKMDQQNDEKVNEPKSIIKRSLKNLKIIDQLELDNEDDQSDSSELSYCSHHSRRSHRHSRGCHRSKSKCKHSRTRCKHHHADSYSNLMLDHESHHRQLSRRKKTRNLSCESLTGDDTDQMTQKQKNNTNNENSANKHRSTQYTQPQQHQTEPNNHKIQNVSNQYLLPPQQFSNQYAYNYNNQMNQNVQDSRAMIVPKYNTINYRLPMNDQQQIQNPNFISTQTPYYPNYSTMTTNFIKPIQYNQPNNQIGLPNVYQIANNQFKTNPNSINQNGMYLMANNLMTNNIPVNSSINPQLIDKSYKQQVYQNLQDYLKEMPRCNKEVPQLPPRNNIASKNFNQPPLPLKPNLNKQNSNIDYKSQSFEDTLYAKPSKLINNSIKNQMNQNVENGKHLNDDLGTEKQQQQQQNVNSGESANSSLQNINNLDSGISICSTSTPTKDLRSNANKSSSESNETSKNNDKVTSPNLELDNLEKKEIINQNECNPNNNGNNEQATTQQSKPLEYYEINTEFNSTGNRPNLNSNALLGEYHPIKASKLKCYEISTEL